MIGIRSAFVGTVGQDAKLRFASQGKAVLNFSVAVSENRPGGDGAETTWLRVSVWKELAEQLAPRLRKGVAVYVEGKLKLTSWTAADGTERSGLNVSAWLVQPLGQIGRRAPRREREGAPV